MKKNCILLCCISVILLTSLFTFSDTTANGNTKFDLTPTPLANGQSDCLEPCWENIISEQSEWINIVDDINNQNWTIGSKSTHPTIRNQISYNVQINRFDRNYPTEPTTIDRSATTGLQVITVDGTIINATINLSSIGEFLEEGNTNYATWDHFKPSTLLEIYNVPNKLWIKVVPVGQDFDVALHMFWENKGLYVMYSMPRQSFTIDPIEFCFNLDSISDGLLTFYSPDTIVDKVADQYYFDLSQEMSFDHIIDVNNPEELSQIILNEECVEIENKFIHNE